MAYTILNTDGTTLLLLADNNVDESTTSLSLVGKNISSYGQYINNNFIKLMANFASTQGNPPRTPLLGQLWYDTSARRLKIYDNGFKAVGGAIVSAIDPGTLTNGDLWYDTTNGQLKVYSGNALYVVAPAFPKTVGENGWVLPPTTVYDDINVPQQVTILKNYGQVVGLISNEQFSLTPSGAVSYFNTATTSTVVAGLTIVGDINVTGQTTERHLSAYVSIEQIAVSTSTVTAIAEYNYQNRQVQALLSAMYPVASNPATAEVGLPIGAECRVICDYESPASGSQVRRFRVVDQAGAGISWQPYEIYSYSTSTFGATLANVMYDRRT
jgi:hypothetical protein